MSQSGASEFPSSCFIPGQFECEECFQNHPGPDLESSLAFEHQHTHFCTPEDPHGFLRVTPNAECSYKTPSDTLAGSDSSTALHPSQNAGNPPISCLPASHLPIPPYAGSSRSDPGGTEGLNGPLNPHSNMQDHIYGQFPVSTKDEVAELAIQSVGSSFGPNTYGDHPRIPLWDFYPENLNTNSTIEDEKGYINEAQSSRFHPEGDIDLAQFRGHLENAASLQGVLERSKSEVPASELVTCPYSSKLCQYNGKQRHDGKPSKIRRSSLRIHKTTCKDRPPSHSGETPALGRVICNECGKTFTLGKDRVRHYKATHLKTTFPCTICGAIVGRPDNLKRHFLKVHGLRASGSVA